MKEINLFKKNNGEWLTNLDILKTLEKLKAHECKLLYIHTELNFGAPNMELGKIGLLETLADIFLELKLPAVVFPTFTFSFCNGVDYDVQKSKSQMGLLNEYIRKRPDAVRSIDPLMSVAVIGSDKKVIENLGRYSTGKDSNFDKIHDHDNVKFLFLGPKIGDCFTYMHYLEWLAKVPYRYDRPFTGNITNEGKTHQDTYYLFVRYKNVLPGRGSYVYEDLLIERGLAQRESCGNSFITCIEKDSASEVYLELLKKNPDFYILSPFNKNEKDETFEVKNMVAL